MLTDIIAELGTLAIGGAFVLSIWGELQLRRAHRNPIKIFYR